MSRQEVWVRPYAESAKAGAKQSFSTRRVPRDLMRTIVGGAVRPRSGDVLLARIARLGHHKHIENPQGRRSHLHEGDEIIVAYADRYATDQFESVVPNDLGPVQFVASGGIASKQLSRSRAVRNATLIVPIGLVGDERGRPINVADFRLETVIPPATRPRTVAVLGTSMNSGKTTTIHYLVHGLARAGVRPGATKVTGTGSGNDYWVMLDAGAHRMLDFTDAGLASTFRQPIPVLENAINQLVGNLTISGCGINLVEIADGVFQTENRRLLNSPVLHELIDTVVLAASDAMGAAQGVRSLTEHGFNVCAISGMITRSPLAAREAEEECGLPLLGIPELSDARYVAPILGLDPAQISDPEPEQPPAWPVEIEGLEGSDDSDELDAPVARTQRIPSFTLPAPDPRFLPSHEVSGQLNVG